MVNSILNDKIVLVAVVLATIIGIYGIFKLRKLNVKTSGSILTDEQSDLLVMGIFHVLICAVCICCLL